MESFIKSILDDVSDFLYEDEIDELNSIINEDKTEEEKLLEFSAILMIFLENDEHDLNGKKIVMDNYVLFIAQDNKLKVYDILNKIQKEIVVESNIRYVGYKDMISIIDDNNIYFYTRYGNLINSYNIDDILTSSDFTVYHNDYLTLIINKKYFILIDPYADKLMRSKLSRRLKGKTIKNISIIKHGNYYCLALLLSGKSFFRTYHKVYIDIISSDLSTETEIWQEVKELVTLNIKLISHEGSLFLQRADGKLVKFDVEKDKVVGYVMNVSNKNEVNYIVDMFYDKGLYFLLSNSDFSVFHLIEHDSSKTEFSPIVDFHGGGLTTIEHNNNIIFLNDKDIYLLIPKFKKVMKTTVSNYIKDFEHYSFVYNFDNKAGVFCIKSGDCIDIYNFDIEN